VSDLRALNLLASALDLPESGRDEFLQQQANGDGELLNNARALLAAHQRSENFLEPIPPASTGLADATVEAPQNIGPYKLTSLLGRGGMGQVWLGERMDGEFSQTVAIKLMSSYLVDAKTLARAEAEREFLAQLNHPNIARILDGGRTTDGMPYVVMEYVKGQPIDEFVNDRKLPIRARVELFLQVLEAIDCAHRALIIHRDIKPGNVMVDDYGQAKLLDFGIAKSLDAGTADATQTGLLALTPNYAAPEQLEGKPLTTTCDIYAAGVLLYELLTGDLPTDRNASMAERIRGLATTQPTRASQRADAGKLALQPRAIKSWRNELHGDLDRVLEKALRYEPEKRYRSAKEFADDLTRWLQSRPVLARGGGRAYALAKFIVRHRLGVAASASAVIALAIGLGLAWHQAQLTQLAAQRSELANAFLSDLISSADPSSDTKTVTLIDAIDRAEKEIPARFSGQPELEAQIRLVIGRGYNALNRLADAEKQFRRVLQIVPARGTEFATATSMLAEIAWSRGELKQAEAGYRSAIAGLVDNDHAQREASMDISSSLDALLADMGRYEESLKMATANLAKLPAEQVTTRADALRRAALLQHVAYDLHGTEKTAQAVEVYQQALALYEKNLPNDHPDIAILLNNKAMAMMDLGQIKDAAELLQRSLDIRRQRFGANHWMLVPSAANLAGIRAQLGEFSVSCSLIQQALATAKIALEPKDPTWARTYSAAARIALLRGDKTDAIALSHKAIALLTGTDVEPSYMQRSQDVLKKAQAMTENPAALKCPLAR
jgi:eukaryotic-like serine/threonine-protein kinase